jgi:hypothetical protein
VEEAATAFVADFDEMAGRTIPNMDRIRAALEHGTVSKMEIVETGEEIAPSQGQGDNPPPEQEDDDE